MQGLNRQVWVILVLITVFNFQLVGVKLTGSIQIFVFVRVTQQNLYIEHLTIIFSKSLVSNCFVIKKRVKMDTSLLAFQIYHTMLHLVTGCRGLFCYWL